MSLTRLEFDPGLVVPDSLPHDIETLDVILPTFTPGSLAVEDALTRIAHEESLRRIRERHPNMSDDDIRELLAGPDEPGVQLAPSPEPGQPTPVPYDELEHRLAS